MSSDTSFPARLSARTYGTSSRATAPSTLRSRPSISLTAPPRPRLQRSQERGGVEGEVAREGEVVDGAVLDAGGHSDQAARRLMLRLDDPDTGLDGDAGPRQSALLVEPAVGGEA